MNNAKKVILKYVVARLALSFVVIPGLMLGLICLFFALALAFFEIYGGFIFTVIGTELYKLVVNNYFLFSISVFILITLIDQKRKKFTKDKLCKQ